MIETYYTTVIGRGDPRGVRYVLAGRRWAKDDLYGHLLESGEWTVLHLPAIRPGSKLLWYDVTVPRGQENVFTEMLVPLPESQQNSGAPYLKYRAAYGGDPTGQGFYWPASPSKRKEALAVKRGKPNVFAITYNGEVDDDLGGLFDEKDFTPYAPPPGLELGLQSPDVRQFIRAAKGKVAGAWDTAFGQSRSESLTANVVGLLVPCHHWHRGEDVAIDGACDFHWDVYLLDLLSENIDFRDLVKAVRAQHAKWGANPEIVEEKASGISLIQSLRGTDVPIRPQKVSEGKIERATNGVGGGAASVQGWVKMGRVFYPAGVEWVKDWLAKMTGFSGDAIKRADEFDATVHLVTYAIEKSVKTVKIPNIEDSEMLPYGQPGGGLIDPRVQMLNGLRSAAEGMHPSVRSAVNPYNGMCGGGCWAYQLRHNRTWCLHHDRQTSAIGGCDRWSETPPPDALQIGDTLHG